MLENTDTLEGAPFNAVMWRELLLSHTELFNDKVFITFLLLHPLHTFFNCLLVDWLLFIVCVLSLFAAYFNRRSFRHFSFNFYDEGI